MLKGDLTSTPLAPLLLELAEDSSTGCLNIVEESGDAAEIYFKGGLVYSVFVPGSRPQLGAKLVSSGALAPEALAEALEAQRSELQGWRLGELLVHLGYVDQPVVEAFVKEQVSEAMWDLLRWSNGRWKFRKNVKAREDVGPPMGVVELLETLRERGYEWETISAIVHGPNAIPRLSTRDDTSAETTLDNDAWSMLCKIDGERSVADLARDCGYTLFEAGHVIVSLVQTGLVDIDEDVDLDSQELYGATTLSSAFSGELEPADEPVEEDALSKLARLVTEVAGEGSEEGAEDATPSAPAQRTEPEPMLVGLNRHNTESFSAAIARVSSALSDVLGEAAPDSSPESELTRVATRRRSAPSTDDPEWQRRKRLRTAAAAELASAQALIETLRPDHDSGPTEEAELTDEVPRLRSTEAENAARAAREAADAQRHADQEAARHAAEEAARKAADDFARAAAEEAQRVAAEQEAARLAAEQAAAQEAARLEAEEAERQAAEYAAQQAAEEAARQAAADAERAAAEAAEEAARLEAERAAAEAAERHAAEVAAAETDAWAEYWHREEAERQAAEEAARIEAERLEAERAEEAERVAAEQAAAEAAARLEAERAEQEAKAAAKAERAARRKAEKAEAEEAQRREDEAAAAAAMLAELNASAQAEAAAVDEPVEEPEPVPEPSLEVAAEVLEPVGAGAPYLEDAESTDTAALLRELSSLGGDEPRESGPPMPPSRPRPTPGPDKKAKKKIGLFGL